MSHRPRGLHCRYREGADAAARRPYPESSLQRDRADPFVLGMRHQFKKENLGSKKRAVCLAAILAVLSIGTAAADTYTVSSPLDSGPGSFRQAIVDANGHAGLDTIAFNIPGSGVRTITPATEL